MCHCLSGAIPDFTYGSLTVGLLREAPVTDFTIQTYSLAVMHAFALADVHCSWPIKVPLALLQSFVGRM